MLNFRAAAERFFEQAYVYNKHIAACRTNPGRRLRTHEFK